MDSLQNMATLGIPFFDIAAKCQLKALANIKSGVADLCNQLKEALHEKEILKSKIESLNKELDTMRESLTNNSQTTTCTIETEPDETTTITLVKVEEDDDEIVVVAPSEPDMGTLVPDGPEDSSSADCCGSHDENAQNFTEIEPGCKKREQIVLRPTASGSNVYELRDMYVTMAEPLSSNTRVDEDGSNQEGDQGTPLSLEQREGNYDTVIEYSVTTDATSENDDGIPGDTMDAAKVSGCDEEPQSPPSTPRDEEPSKVTNFQTFWERENGKQRQHVVYRGTSGDNGHGGTHCGDTIECELCGKDFFERWTLERRGETHSADICYRCEVCGIEFQERSSFYRHVSSHTGAKPFKCDTCEKSFRDKNYLQKHIRIHSEESPYRCDTCDRSFCLKSQLDSHIRIHTGEKPYNCNVCGRGFSVNGNLVIHMRKHTGERPFQCEVCKKAFRSRDSLKKHIGTHSEEKPYSCHVCSKNFRMKGHLDSHLRNHAENKPFKCETCGHTFSEKGRLIRHMGTHSGVKPYKCDICQKRFLYKDYLQKHQNVHRQQYY